MRVHVQYARYIKRFELFPSWMLKRGAEPI